MVVIGSMCSSWSLAAWYLGLWTTQTWEYHLLEFMGQRRPCSGLGFLIKDTLLALYSALSNNWLGLGVSGMTEPHLKHKVLGWFPAWQTNKQINFKIEESAFPDLTGL